MNQHIIFKNTFDPFRKTLAMTGLVLLCLNVNPDFALAQSTAKTKPVIQLSLNENPFGPSALVKKGIQDELVNIARYSGSNGEELIAALAKKEGVDPEQIITGELLELLGVYLGIKGGPGSEFIYTVPGYPALVNAAAKVGGKVISIPLNAALENDLPAISAAINEKTQAVFLVNPHNPSGTVTDNKTFHDFLHQASSKALIIVDEAYLEFSDDFKGRTAVSNTRSGDNVIVFRTFAKAYGLAGLALGYAVAPKPIASFLKEQGLGSPQDLNRLSVAAVLAALKDESYIERVNKSVVSERRKWFSLLDQLDLKYTVSEANFVYFDTRKPYATVAAALKENGIQIGRAFAPYDTWVRISIGLPEENVKAREVIRKLLGSGQH